jgi:hypothetical protein
MKLLAFGLVLLGCLQGFVTCDYQGKVFTVPYVFATSDFSYLAGMI